MAFDSEDFKGPGGVNVAECLRVADAIERSPTFAMHRAFHQCGSPACIIGHAYGFDAENNTFEGAAAILGISYAFDGDSVSRQLFMPKLPGADFRASPGSKDFITNAHAAACLRKLAATGVVDWLGTKPASNSEAK